MISLKKLVAPLLYVLSMASPLLGQQLYMPFEIRKAYENGTRNWDGSVSDLYSQNSSRYKIKANVNPVTRQLEASAEITYFNNSQEPLISLGMHAYKDVFEEGMIIKKLVVAGETLDIKDTRRVRKSDTHYGIYIGKNPFQSGDSIKLEIEWSITIPETVARDGAYDKTSMFVAYWYPEIAVYDDVFGWDMIDHDGYSEFYHDFSSYDIEITIPDNYIVWASTDPINGDDVYPSLIAERLNQARQTGQNTSIVSKKDLNKLKMKSNVWKYSVKNFQDFTFAFSDHYVWDASSYQDQYGQYFLNSVYPPENKTFSSVLQIQKEGLEIFHNDFPKQPFPYRHFVAFNGERAGGMEFPGMCNNQALDGYKDSSISLSAYEMNKLLTFHEMMHMYFPFMMGINEKRYAWMDEGMAEFLEINFSGIDLSSAETLANHSSSINQPLMIETHTIPKHSTYNSYTIASHAYLELYRLLGPELFHECLTTYIDTWKNKHPIPFDFFFTFNKVSKRDLNWFWKAWFFDWGYVDIGIEEFKDGKLTLANEGGRPVMTEVTISFADGSEKRQLISAEVWKNSTRHTLPIDNSESVTSLQLSTSDGFDAVDANNRWKLE